MWLTDVIFLLTIKSLMDPVAGFLSSILYTATLQNDQEHLQAQL